MNRMLHWGWMLCLGAIVVATATAQVVPPINLSAELLQGGQVALNWDEPPDGLVEDFEDGVAQNFFYDPDASWSVEDGFLKVTPGNGWQSAWYEGLSFTDFTLEVVFENVASTNSRGIMFRASGPQNTGGSGYSMYVAYNVVNYSIYRHNNGSLVLIHGWTPSGDINIGVGDRNTLKVVGQGSDFDIYINDIYQSSFSDSTYAEGFVGMVASSQVEAWYDTITCLPAATLRPATARQTATPGIPSDPQGRPLRDRPVVDGGPVPHDPAPVLARSDNRLTSELDEFIEYRVYRDGAFIGTADSESFTDQLPGLGTYEYTVTALYDEGESSPAGPATVTWDPVYLTLTGSQTVVPPNGGQVIYGVELTSTLPLTFPGVTYWTEVQLPNGQTFGPLFSYTFTLVPFMQVDVFNIAQSIPGLAPPGIYVHTGHVGMYPVAQVSDSFEFEKLGAASSPAEGSGPGPGLEFDPAQWPVERLR